MTNYTGGLALHALPEAAATSGRQLLVLHVPLEGFEPLALVLQSHEPHGLLEVA